jgi:hypothetical protein
LYHDFISRLDLTAQYYRYRSSSITAKWISHVNLYTPSVVNGEQLKHQSLRYMPVVGYDWLIIDLFGSPRWVPFRPLVQLALGYFVS